MINRRVTTQFQFSKELVEEQKHIMGAEELSSTLNRQLIERFVNEMLSTRLQDLKTEEVIGSDGKSNLEMKLELFVFNKEELTKLIEDVEKRVILNNFIESVENKKL
jgi:hypothetical protein